MKIETRKLADLTPYENNPRKNDHAVTKVAAAIKEFGFRIPIIIKKDGAIIDGHLRYKAAKEAGLAEVPCMLGDDMSDAQIKAFRISVNKVAELAKWDSSLLAMELKALGADDFDLSIIGYDEHELDDLLGELPPEKDQDAVPASPKIPATIPGDRWLLGNHVLLCGDSTSVTDLQTLMGGGNQADMIFTDPPYNVDYSGTAGKIKNDNMSAAEFDLFLGGAFNAMASVLSPGGGVYVACADSGKIGITFREAFLAADFHLSACLIWRKNQFTLSRSDYQWMHEPILYGWKLGKPHRYYGGRKKRTIQDFSAELVTKISASKYHIQNGDDVLVVTEKEIKLESHLSSIITEDKPLENKEHPTIKPVALVERFVKNSSKTGEVVLDPFGGSGSTLIACEKTGRHCRTNELDEKYCDVIINRWQDFTGEQATLDSDGRTFAEIKESRA